MFSVCHDGKTKNRVQRYEQIAVQYIEDIQIFGMNMPFISSSEAKMHIS